jgi:hypothetical protein
LCIPSSTKSIIDHLYTQRWRFTEVSQAIIQWLLTVCFSKNFQGLKVYAYIVNKKVIRTARKTHCLSNTKNIRVWGFGVQARDIQPFALNICLYLLLHSPIEVLPKYFSTSNAELNSICSFLALLGAHHILHVSRVRVNIAPHGVKLSNKIEVPQGCRYQLWCLV